MEEIQKYDCLDDKFSLDYKDKFKRLNCWNKIGETFIIIIIIYNILTRYNFTVIKIGKEKKSDFPTGRAYLQDLTNYS